MGYSFMENIEMQVRFVFVLIEFLCRMVRFFCKSFYQFRSIIIVMEVLLRECVLIELQFVNFVLDILEGGYFDGYRYIDCCIDYFLYLMIGIYDKFLEVFMKVV